ncbi:DUF4097 family beta strand repeat-containing protein [Bacteroidota bacterium]
MRKLLLLSFIISGSLLFSKEYTDQISKEIKTSGNLQEKVLYFGNLFGSVDVEGYKGNTIKIEVLRNIQYESNEELEIAKEELQLMLTETNKGYLLHYNMPEVKIDEEKMRTSFNFCGESLEYKFEFNVKIMVPEDINLHISTVDKGDVSIEKTSGLLEINNVNGSISMKDVSSITEVSTVNGSIEISFNKNPAGKSVYKTINGDIRLKLKNEFSSTVEFTSMNGDLYTDFENIEYHSHKIDKQEHKEGIRYEIKSNPTVQFGNGKNQMNMSSINGSFYLLNNE